MNPHLPESFLLHTLLDHFPDYIYFKDNESRFLLINKSLAQRYGLTHPSEALNKTDHDFFTAEHADPAMRDEKGIMATGKPILDMEERITWLSGEVDWVSSSKMPLLDPNGNVVGTFGISRDITARKKAQLALQEMTEQLRIKNTEYESDLSIAAELQEALINYRYPSFPALTSPEQSRLQFCHRYQPSSLVGGDFFEVLAVSDQQAGILFGDVVGHGVQSALVMGMIRALVAPHILEASDPAKFLYRLNTNLLSTLKRANRDLYATASYGIINTTTGVCQLANAGQTTPIWIRKNQGECLQIPKFQSRGPLGLFNVDVFPSTIIELQPEDSLIFFTDGLMDVNNAQGHEFGKESILRITQANAHRSVPEIMDILLAEAIAFSEGKAFDDDVCLLGVTYRTPALT